MRYSEYAKDILEVRLKLHKSRKPISKLLQKITPEATKDWLTYSIALYTSARTEHRLRNYLSAYRNIVVAHQIVEKILGNTTQITMRYEKFMRQLAGRDEVIN